jgi:hypothetical protein
MFMRADGQERVQPIDVGVRWDPGAPMPHLLQSESRTFLVFHVFDQPPGRIGTVANVTDSTSFAPRPLGVVQWVSCRGAVLGSPNDEAYHGHRLWDQGLSDVGAYRAAEVLNSSWVAGLETANRVHPRHRPEAFASDRHFILGFHDSTFECVATGFRTWMAAVPMPEMLATLAGRLDDHGRESSLGFAEIKRG